MLNTKDSFFDLTPIPHISIDKEYRIIIANRAAAQLLGRLPASIKDKPLSDFIKSEDHEQYIEWLQNNESPLTVLHLQETANGAETRFQLRKTHTEQTTLIALTPLPTHPLSANSPLPETHEKRHLDTSELRRIEVTDALNDSIIAITSTLELNEVLDKILENVKRVIPHDAADIMLVQGAMAVVARSHGYEEQGLYDVIDSLRFHIDTTPTLAQMLKSHEPIVIADLQATLKDVERPRANWMRAYVSVPIQIDDAIIGFMNLISSEPESFSDEHVHWLESFAAHAAIAINNARVHDKTRELAVTEERQRMAREIHDSVSQMLFSSSMIAAALASSESTNPDDLKQNVSHIYRLNRGALAEMRLLLLEYKPENLVKAQLPTLLERLKEAVEGRTQITIELEIDDGHQAPPEERLVLYRIAQEALNNIAKHSQAEVAHVKYITNRNSAILTIIDKGIGFDAAKLDEGLGLQSMRERAESIGATFTVESKIGEGTTITVHWVDHRIS